jgi:hypothetical protein
MSLISQKEIAMNEQRTPATEAEVLQMMIAEHNNLQAIRSGTIFDSNGRTNLFLGTVSSAVVALAFIGQTSGMTQPFLLFALILLPSLMFIGLVTFLRVYQSGVEDMYSARGINRIRHYYTEIAPQMKPYFMLSTHDDMQGMTHNMGALNNQWQLFLSTAGLVGVLNSVLTAVFAGMLTFALFNAALPVCIIAGVVFFVISVAWHIRYQDQTVRNIEKEMTVLFPSPHESEKA